MIICIQIDQFLKNYLKKKIKYELHINCSPLFLNSENENIGKLTGIVDIMHNQNIN